jgi:purine-binding chemotaxis protein CheW
VSQRAPRPSPDDKQVLAERARRLAMPVESRQDEDLLSLTGFVIAGDRYALENRFIRAVVPSRDATPLPGVPDWVLGVTNIRGEVVLVIDLRRFFGLPPGGVRPDSRLVVCGIESIEFAIVVDEVEGTSAMSASDIEPVPATLPRAFPQFVRGIATDALTILDGAALLADRRLRVDQTESKEL